MDARGGEEFLEDLCFVDDLNGWAVGDEGMVVKTTDGGSNWDVMPSGTATRLEAVDFVDSQNGWAAGQDKTIIHTKNFLLFFIWLSPYVSLKAFKTISKINTAS